MLVLLLKIRPKLSIVYYFRHINKTKYQIKVLSSIYDIISITYKMIK